MARAAKCLNDDEVLSCTNYATDLKCKTCAVGHLNVDGDCHSCQDDYYDDGSGNCVSCSCDPLGSASLDCTTYQCSCKTGYGGAKCDSCAAGYELIDGICE
eukprot:Pgem_evm1s17141